MVFGQSTAVGRWLIDHGVSLVFTWSAAVISAIVVSFPLVYRTALGAFEALDSQMLDAARTLGWSEWRIFHSLMLPLGWPSIAAGTVLAFAPSHWASLAARCFRGQLCGHHADHSIAIYFEWMGGDTDVALFWVLVVIAFSFLVILFINLYTARSPGLPQPRLHQGSRRPPTLYTWALGCRAFKMRRFWTMTRLRAAMRCTSTAMPYASLCARTQPRALRWDSTGAVSTGRGSSSPSSATRDGKGGR